MPIQLPVVGMAAAALFVAAVVALISTPVVRSLAFRIGAVDVPKDNRRMHDHPIPRMGGLAIFFGFLLSVLVFLPLTLQLRSMLLGAVVIVILGIFDDIYALSAKLKFMVQIFAALLAVLGSAIGQSLYRDDRVGDHLPLLALGVLFSCWQTLSACVLSGVNRQGASAGIALAADSVQLVLTCLTVGRWGMGGYAFSFALSALLGAVLSWRVVSREIGLSLPVFSWFTAPTLAACLAASCGDLMETVLLRAGLVSFPAAVGGLCFGLLLYLAALQAMGAGSKGGGLPP